MSSSGLISGQTSDAVGNFSFIVEVTDANGNKSAPNSGVFFYRIDVAASTTFKWNPGHYTQSNSWLSAAKISNVLAEIDLTLPSANVLGFCILARWRDYETAQNVYDWTYIDQVRNYIATNYPGKRLAVVLVGVRFDNTNPTGCIPDYILNNPATYGQGFDGVRGGYWQLGNYGTTCAWWRASIITRLTALFDALATHTSPYGGGAYTYDTDPYFESISYTETAIDLASTPGDYSFSAAKTQWQALLANMRVSWPHTSIMDQNNFFGYTGSSQTLTSQITLEDCTSANALAAASSPDVYYPVASFTWGQKGYIGAAAGGTPGFTSLYQQAPYMAQVQQPDYSRASVANIMISAINNPGQSPAGLGSSHVFWCVISGGGAGDWTTQVLPVINANPIPAGNQIYPSLYP
jgi:hypothetical protein